MRELITVMFVWLAWLFYQIIEGVERKKEERRKPSESESEIEGGPNASEI